MSWFARRRRPQFPHGNHYTKALGDGLPWCGVDEFVRTCCQCHSRLVLPTPIDCIAAELSLHCRHGELLRDPGVQRHLCYRPQHGGGQDPGKCRGLVGAKLAACVNIVPGVTSV
ncbi:uncharacterized protein LOC108673204 isoform X2 [Hyalella azteca]|uniref:Uncharacterized protein LOC108673204 isoform X2 n=1 Tax=Hyalella azteca TaxID=294128 RepID=A0A979FKK1_HYAAZ|nr:uncharacterized protein LOC108673204 isoform X2 [Hyalella azteca]